MLSACTGLSPQWACVMFYQHSAHWASATFFTDRDIAGDASPNESLNAEINSKFQPQLERPAFFHQSHTGKMSVRSRSGLGASSVSRSPIKLILCRQPIWNLVLSGRFWKKQAKCISRFLRERRCHHVCGITGEFLSNSRDNDISEASSP